MNSIHLTDEVLQAFILKEMQDDAIAAHLAVCSTCCKKRDEYLHLINNVQKVKAETFSFDITTLAMNKIMRYEKKRSKKQDLVFWGLLTVLLIAISSLSIPYMPKVLAVFNSKNIFTILLVVGTGLGVLLFLWADTIRQYKKKEEKLFKKNVQPIL